MMKGILIAILITVAGVSRAQEIKRVKINALEEYIRNSNRPLIISFWATWCAPCINEIPWLQAAVEKYKDHEPELVLVSLDFKEAFPRRIVETVRSKNFKATFFWLDETNADLFCPRIDEKWDGGIPANLFVNPKTNYRKFFDRQITELQTDKEIKLMLQL